MGAKIYHNPRCGKSRQTLALLRLRGIEPEVVEYLKTPPSAPELGQLLRLLGMEPRALMPNKEPEYKARKLGESAMDRDALIAAMVECPILIERPIVVANGKAALGRPPESVIAIL